MAVPEHLLQFLNMNTAGRVVLMCHARRIFDAEKARFYTRAVTEAVLALSRDSDPSVVEIDRLLKEQLEMLDVALDRPPVPRLPKRASPPEDESEPVVAPSKTRRENRNANVAATESLSMEEKLQEARRPVRDLLLKDCVRLGLVELKRAKTLAAGLAGKSREEGEADIVSELRNNLHKQIRTYMRKHKGGPWDSVMKQEDLRLDITHTSSVHALVTLTRQLLKERKDWEGKLNKGLLHNLLGGKS